MAYSPAYSKAVFSSDEQATSVKQNQQSDNIEHVYKFTARLGDGAAGDIKMARGKASLALSGTDNGSVRVDMKADGLDNGITFASAPVVIVTVEHPGGTIYNILYQNIAWPSPFINAFDFFMKFNTAHTATYTIHWLAIGS